MEPLTKILHQMPRACKMCEGLQGVTKSTYVQLQHSEDSSLHPFHKNGNMVCVVFWSVIARQAVQAEEQPSSDSVL
jgi:hypothetical protein